ncbi:MAG TPA: SPOR domain-containing protein [Alphaproteobacteria bacterium]|nr:SPOR domain-containing protein [Alphaproteobacteria bacterium]
MGHRILRAALAAMAPVLAMGCAAPSALTLASASFDGMSYATSGKSVTDMAVSQARQENCSTWRILVGDPICRAYTPEEKKKLDESYAKIDPQEIRARRMGEPDIDAMNAFAAKERSEREIRVATAANTPAGGSLGSGSLAASPPSNPRPAAARAVEAGRRYLVLASFSSRSHAERALARYADARPLLAAARVGGETLYRVVSGPIAPEAVGGAKARAATAYGVHDVWMVSGCPAGAANSGCVTPVATLPQLASR